MRPSVSTRLGSMLLDQVITSVIAVLPMAIVLFLFVSKVEHLHEPFAGPHEIAYVYFCFLGFGLFFCKDCIGGRSIGKRIMRLQVVENATNLPASPLRTFVRNLFTIIWPLEVFITFINPTRRLGDLVAGTRVIVYQPQSTPEKTNFAQVAIVVLLSLGLSAGFVFAARHYDETKESKFTYVPASLNEQAANELEKTYTDSLGQWLTPDVRVYDHINEDSTLRYVSVVLQLKENYLEKDDSYKRLKAYTLPILRAQFAEGTYIGQITYYYGKPTQFESKTEYINRDWKKKKEEALGNPKF